jgi:hypothetical protein
MGKILNPKKWPKLSKRSPGNLTKKYREYSTIPGHVGFPEKEK